jgi:hypothetical protein
MHWLAASSEIFCKCRRLIVLYVARRVEQRDRAACAHGKDLCYRIRIAVELDRVANTELLPAVGTMIKPFAQVRAWGNVLEPNHITEPLLADPAWPNAVYQNSLPITRGPRVIDSLNLHICHFFAVPIEVRTPRTQAPQRQTSCGSNSTSGHGGTGGLERVVAARVRRPSASPLIAGMTLHLPRTAAAGQQVPSGDVAGPVEDSQRTAGVFMHPRFGAHIFEIVWRLE